MFGEQFASKHRYGLTIMQRPRMDFNDFLSQYKKRILISKLMYLVK